MGRRRSLGAAVDWDFRFALFGRSIAGSGIGLSSLREYWIMLWGFHKASARSLKRIFE